MPLRCPGILALTAPFLAGLVLSPWAALADVPITFALTGANNWINIGGYTGPYQVHVAGVTYWLVCDASPADFSVGRQWSLKQYTLPAPVAGRGCRWWDGNRWPATGASQDYTWEAGNQWYAQAGTDGPQEFATAHGVLYPEGTAISSTVQPGYDAAAWPVYRPVTDLPLQTLPSTPADYSGLIGQIFSPEASYGDGGTTPYPRLAPDQPDQGTSDAALTLQATSNGSVRSALDSAVNLYTPVDLGSGGLVSTSQKFTGIGSRSEPVLQDDPLPVPEASTVAFLLLDLLALPVIVFLMRRRIRHDA